MKKVLLLPIFLLTILSSFVLADGNSSTNSTGCNIPTCQGAYNTGNIDTNGCAIYACPICKDSDGGLSYSVRGQTKLINPNPNSTSTGFDDVCLNSVTLSEGYCRDNEIITQKYDCPNGCSDGVCVGEVKTPEGDIMNSCLDNPTSWWDQQTNQCYKEFSKELIATSCSDPDGGINKYLVAHTFGFRSVFADSRDQRIRTGGEDACQLKKEGYLSNNQLVEHYCDESGYIQTTYLACPNGCQNGVCIKGKDITETITCILKGFKSENECYLAGQSGPEDQGTKWCKGTESCTIKFTGEEREEITWKSSCGGYQYTNQDGNDETITFDCSSGEKNSTLIVETYFRNAYWQCQDGEEFKEGGETSCKSYSLWKKYAISSCNDRSSTVTSFSLSNICYPEGEKPIVGEGGASGAECEGYLKACKSDNKVLCDKWETNCRIKEETNQTKIEALICKDSCPIDNKCYPFGYRKADKFCSDSGAFVAQLKADAQCDNNFECGSNVCINNKCINPGLIEKILNWFRKLFS